MAKPKKLPPLLLILLLALAFALLIFALGNLRIDHFSDWLGSLFSREEDNVSSAGDQYYEQLLDQLRAPNADPVPIDSLTLAEAFAHYAFDTDYHHVYTVSYRDGERETHYTVSLDRHGEEYRLSIYRGESVREDALLYTGALKENIFQVQDGMDNRHFYPAGEDFPYFSVVLQPNPQGIMDMLRTYEQAPEQSAFSDCQLTLEMTEHGRRLVVLYTERETGDRGEYAYLLDYGVLESAAVMRNGTTWYTLSTQQISSVVSLDGNA